MALDDELVRKAQVFSGVTERTALLREALKALIHLEASRGLAAVGGGHGAGFRSDQAREG